MNSMWPVEIPDDLRRELDTLLTMRSLTSAEIWTSLTDWFQKHDVEAPILPENKKLADEILLPGQERIPSADHK